MSDDAKALLREVLESPTHFRGARASGNRVIKYTAKRLPDELLTRIRGYVNG